MASETDIVKQADELEPPFYESSLGINRDTEKWIEAACDEITRLRAASSAAADEVGRLRRVAQKFIDDVDALRERSNREKRVLGGKRCTIVLIDDACEGIESIRSALATDASGAMKHTPTTGGQGETKGATHEK